MGYTQRGLDRAAGRLRSVADGTRNHCAFLSWPGRGFSCYFLAVRCRRATVCEGIVRGRRTRRLSRHHATVNHALYSSFAARFPINVRI